MKIDITPEIVFKTARSGGKGGQNVNKVETMVEGRWAVAQSNLVGDAQKAVLLQKLANKITADGFLLVKSQTERTQIGNKSEVVRKMNELVNNTLVKRKPRIAAKIPKGVIEKRLEGKKQKADVKQNRRKIRPGEF